METAKARKRTRRSPKLWLGVLFVVLAAAVYPAYKVGSAIYNAQVRERTLEECELLNQPPGTKIVALETTDSGLTCVFADQQGRVLGRAKP